MKVVDKLDAFFGDVFQWVVDVTGKKPAWWVEQCAYGVLVSSGVFLAFVETESSPTRRALSMAAALMLAVWGWLDAQSPMRMKRTAEQHWLRRALMVAMVITLPIVIIGAPSLTASALFVMRDLFLLGLVYFPGCRPPAPRPPKHRAAMAGGSA